MPFNVNFEFISKAYKNMHYKKFLNIKAIFITKQLKKLYTKIKKKLKFIRLQINKYYNQKKLKKLIFKKKNIVYLFTKNIIIKHLSYKLENKFFGLYKIIKKISKNNY